MNSHLLANAPLGFQPLFSKQSEESLPARDHTVPMRSPATSIVLAEAVCRSETESRSFWTRARAWLRDLFTKPSTQDIKPSSQVSVAFTPSGPLVYQCPRLWKISAEAVSPETSLRKSQRRLQKISAGISLVILSLGFSLLGVLLFANKPHADLANVPCVGSASCIAGSAASLLAGTTFLVASCVYWRRYPEWPA
jgi:hypothetical protein